MYSKWLSFCPLFNLRPNVVWFNMVLRGLNATQKMRGYCASPLNIPDFIEIFCKRVPRAVNNEFHLFIYSFTY